MSDNRPYARPATPFDAADVSVPWKDLAAAEGIMLPIGTVTLLLADVEGSTRLWEAEGAEMPARLAAADAVINEAISAHNGVRPVEQGEGDSFVAAFTRASDAVACAVDIQQRLIGGPLRYRMGIHAGEVQLRGEGNYSGVFINRAARMRDVGHGGQVLLSRVATDLIGDHLPEGATLVDLGEHRLRDLARPETIYQLVHPDLRADFPPLRSLDTLPQNLPVQLSTFVGRQRELAELTVTVPASRLVTLTGSGGCGKTRLALEVAAVTIEEFPDGVWFCDLSALADGDQVAETVAAAIGLPRRGGSDWEHVLCEHLGHRRALLVLDNCEHLVEACADLADRLLRSCPRLAILATSREPLGVSGEVNWRVPSLAAPDRRRPTPIDALGTFDAVRLFIDRARQARPNFVVTDDNAPAIADICARLDGIPLAIELAAARVRVLGVDQIQAGLNDRFRLLGGGARTAMPRQQTLLASVAWSYDLLGDRERIVLRRLAVFAGGFSLDAAEQVVSGDGVVDYEVLDLLSQLVDRSLVQMDDTGGRLRYRLLETMRQYAADRLIETGEAAEVRDRHLAYYDRWLDDAWQRHAPSGDEGALVEIDPDIDNVRDALAWALDNPEQAPVGLHMVGRLWFYWLVRGRYGEGRRWTESLLATAVAADDETRGEALLTHAWMADLAGDFPAAVASAQQAADIAKATGNEILLARAWEKIGWPLGMFDYETAARLLRESIDIAKRLGDRRTAGMSLFFLAFHESLHGEFDAAMQHFEDSLVELRLAPGSLPWAELRAGQAFGAGLQGRLQEAATWIEEASKVFEAVGDPYWTMIGHVYRASVAFLAGDVSVARAEQDAAAAAATHVDSLMTALSGSYESLVLMLEGRTDEVEAAAEPWLAQVGYLGPTVGSGLEAGLRGAIALARLAAGDGDGAVASAKEAAAVARQANTPAYSPVALIAAGAVFLGADDEQAEQAAHDVLAAAASAGANATAPAGLELLAAVARRQESRPEACRLLAAAARAREVMGTVPSRWGVDVAEEIATLRAEMDGDAFEKAWQEGAALDLADAVAYAQRGRGERKRPSHGWAALTPTEEQVAGLVAEGLSNPDIAERLFMSRRTVASHLTHVFAKLNIRTRSELTAAVLRRR